MFFERSDAIADTVSTFKGTVNHTPLVDLPSPPYSPDGNVQG